jgi:chemotaxis signal transduction protein
MIHELGLRELVDDLRRAFDETFARPPAPPQPERERFLGIRSAGRPLAFRLADLTRLEPRREIVPLPSVVPALLGLAGIQGRLTPVYGLASLFGLREGDEERRWIAVFDDANPLGLAFGAVDCCFSVEPNQILELAGTGGGAPALGAVRHGGQIRDIVSLQSIEASIAPRAGAGAAGELQSCAAH